MVTPVGLLRLKYAKGKEVSSPRHPFATKENSVAIRGTGLACHSVSLAFRDRLCVGIRPPIATLSCRLQDCATARHLSEYDQI
jgi:hypothetical protein